VTSRIIRRPQRNQWTTDDLIIDTRIGENVVGILASGKNLRLLIWTETHDHLWAIPDIISERGPLLTRDVEKRGHWIKHGTNPDALISMTTSTATIHRWSTLERLQIIGLTGLPEPFTTVGSIMSLHHPRYFAVVAIEPTRTKSLQHVLQMYDFNDFSSQVQTMQSIRNFGTLSSVIDTVVGIFNDRLIFLNIDNWICSCEISPAEATHIRHFFIPNDWVSLVSNLMLDIARNGEIIYAKRADLLVIKRGLEMTEKGGFNPARKRSMGSRLQR
jgi:hypothetical protein